MARSDANGSKVKTTDLLDRPIAFHRCFVTITGTVTAALMLSQAVYWSKRTKEDGWFYKTQEEWTEETGLTRGEQDEARKRLKSYGYLDEKRQGMPARLHYRVNDEAITKALNGQIKELTLEEIIENFSTSFVNLSRAGVMRAKRLGVEYEFVDYQAVLEAHGAICHICKSPITSGPGQKQNEMAFDHVQALNDGGSHIFSNLRPSHVACNTRKGDDSSFTTVDEQDSLQQSNKSDYSNQTSSSTVSKHVSLHKRSIIGTEITTETTTERENARAFSSGENPFNPESEPSTESELKAERLFPIIHGGCTLPPKLDRKIERRIYDCISNLVLGNYEISQVQAFIADWRANKSIALTPERLANDIGEWVRLHKPAPVVELPPRPNTAGMTVGAERAAINGWFQECQRIKQEMGVAA